MSGKSPLFLRTIALIKKIPAGKVLTYSKISQLIGAPGCARHVSYILSSSADKYELPWHRVINSKGEISLREYYHQQKKRLENEGVLFQRNRVDLSKFQWRPTPKTLESILAKLPKHIPLKVR
jgi:methylated-DNA-protein-cysteine methyltransferase-like protein